MTQPLRALCRWILFFVDEAVVVGLLVLCLLLLVFYYYSLVVARNALIKRLETKLKHTSKDKVFLLSKKKPAHSVAAGS